MMIASAAHGGAWPTLPENAPPPTMLPTEQHGPPRNASDAPPVPTPRPGNGDHSATTTPAQSSRPPGPESPGNAAEPPQKYLADERSGVVAEAQLPGEEAACRTRLKLLGVVFRDEKALSSPDGCALPYPVSVSTLAQGIALDPPGTMGCAMAETLSRFATGPVQSSARAAYGKGVKAILQASAYVCRPRNGTPKLSEHAFGNALDIAGMTLEDGTVLSVGSSGDPKATGVLEAVRRAACGPFKTVLGPGSDADHATHLHLDLAPRRNGGLFCQ